MSTQDLFWASSVRVGGGGGGGGFAMTSLNGQLVVAGGG